MNQSWLARAFRTVLPGWALARAQARAALDGLARAEAMYAGAARSHRTDEWRAVSSSANTEIRVSLARLRDVSRDLRRNNALAASAITVISSHVVGAGIIPTFSLPRMRAKKALRALVRRHLNTTAIDYDGRHNLDGLERLVMETVAESGECLVVRYTPPASLRLPVPLQVRVIEPDYLDASKDGPQPGGHICFEGIELDAHGRRVAYWLYDEHPGGSLSSRLPTSRRVPAADVRHIYRQDRPGQMRGVPWCAPVIVTMRDLADYKDARLMREKIAACFAVFLKNSTSTSIAQNVASERTRAGSAIEHLEPGGIFRLPTGVEPSFATPPSVQDAEFISVREHEIAAGYGVPYELMTGNLKEVSFISGRLGLKQFERRIDQWRWHMLIPQMCEGVGAWFLEAASIALGYDVTDAESEWTPPRRDVLEPAKEIPAMRDAIRSGLTSRSEEVRALGFDPEKIDEENAADNARADGFLLGYDSDGRRPVNFKPVGNDDAKAAA